MKAYDLIKESQADLESEDPNLRIYITPKITFEERNMIHLRTWSIRINAEVSRHWSKKFHCARYRASFWKVHSPSVFLVIRKMWNEWFNVYQKRLHQFQERPVAMVIYAQFCQVDRKCFRSEAKKILCLRSDDCKWRIRFAKNFIFSVLIQQILWYNVSWKREYCSKKV